jgi:apolipoprotein N-acyltransferase
MQSPGGARAAEMSYVSLASRGFPRSPLVRYGLAILATAALTALAAPPFSFSPLALVALAPLCWVTTSVTSWWRALLVGLCASAATTLLVFHWVPGSVHAFFGLPIPAAWAVFPIYGAVAQPQLVVWAVARWQWRDQRGGGALFASAALYAGLDWLLPKLFRDTLGVAFFADRWAIQVADLGGLYLLTFAAVFVAEVACAVAFHRRRALRPALAAGALWLAILGYGAVRSAQIERAVAAAPTFSAGVVQANIGNIEKEIAARGDLDGIVGTLRRYGELSDQLVHDLPDGQVPPDVIVWPETAYPLAYGAHRSGLDDEMDAELASYTNIRKVPLLFGGYRRHPAAAGPPGKDVEYNSALLLSPDGKLAAYHKFHLIPFGEYIPLLGRAKFGTGGEPRVLTLELPAKEQRPARSIKLGPVICYESLIPSHAIAAVDEGAQALINLTNDSWFLSDSEKELHFAMAAVRSVETRRAQLRATNTGISALISPTGEISGRGPIDAPAALRYDVPILDEPPTLVMRAGTWTGPAGLIGCMLWLAFTAHRLRRRLPA